MSSVDSNPFKLKKSETCFLDIEDARQQKEYEHYQHLTPAQRIACVEHLRQMWHGPDALNARIQRVFSFAERP